MASIYKTSGRKLIFWIIAAILLLGCQNNFNPRGFGYILLQSTYPEDSTYLELLLQSVGDSLYLDINDYEIGYHPTTSFSISDYQNFDFICYKNGACDTIRFDWASSSILNMSIDDKKYEFSVIEMSKDRKGYLISQYIFDSGFEERMLEYYNN